MLDTQTQPEHRREDKAKPRGPGGGGEGGRLGVTGPALGAERHPCLVSWLTAQSLSFLTSKVGTIPLSAHLAALL